MEEKRKVRALQFDPKIILTLLKEGKLELAAKAIKEFQINLAGIDFASLIEYFNKQIKISQFKEKIRE